MRIALQTCARERECLAEECRAAPPGMNCVSQKEVSKILTQRCSKSS